MKITKLEKNLLDAFCESDSMYVDHLSGYATQIEENQMSGVVASLLKKDLVTQYIDEEFKMSVLTLTVAGEANCKYDWPIEIYDRALQKLVRLN